VDWNVVESYILWGGYLALTLVNGGVILRSKPQRPRSYFPGNENVIVVFTHRPIFVQMGSIYIKLRSKWSSTRQTLDRFSHYLHSTCRRIHFTSGNASFLRYICLSVYMSVTPHSFA